MIFFKPILLSFGAYIWFFCPHHPTDRRERWYKYNDNMDKTSNDHDQERGRERKCSQNGREANEVASTDENFEAAIVEAKRKGVARSL